MSRPKLSAILFAMMLREFQRGPSTATEIAELTGIGRITVVKWLRILHEKGCLHVVEWEPGPTGALMTRCPVYGLGEGKDAPKPRALTSIEKHARERSRAVQTVRMAA